MIYRYELKKLTGMTKILWIYLGLIAICVGIQTAFIYGEHIREEKSEVYYKEYMYSLEGEVTAAKEMYIVSERERIQNALDKREEMNTLYNDGEISQEEFYEYNDELLYARAREESLKRVEEAYAHIKENDGWFVYDTEWNRLFSTDIYGFLLALFLSATFSFYIGNEYSSGMWQYLDSSVNGKEKTIKAKCFIAVFTTIVLSFVYYYIRYILFMVMGDIPLAAAPLGSLSMFYHVGNSFSIGMFFFITAFLQSLAASGLVLIILFFTYLIRNGIVAMAIGLGMYFIPFLVKQYSGEIFSFSFCGTMNIAQSIASLQETWKHIIVFCLAPILFGAGVMLMYIYKRRHIK